MKQYRRMQCMEVWGGNHAVDQQLALGGLDARVYSRPHGAADAGGDVHYISSCASGRITRLLLADVSGHGASVAATAEHLRGLMRRYINYVSPRRLTSAMNERFGDHGDAGCFATALITSFFVPTRRLTVCNAGHPPPMCWRGATARWSLLETVSDGAHVTDLPLGVLDDTGYARVDVRLDPGDIVICHTDSLLEVRDGRGSVLGSEGLLALAGSLDMAQPDTIVDQLLDAVTAYDRHDLNDDDVTLIALRATGAGVSWRNTLAAPGRLVAAWLRQRCRPQRNGSDARLA